MRLSEKAIKRLPLPERGNKIHYDEDVPGFGLRLTKAGGRAFVVNYRVNGHERRLTIGPWPAWSATAAREYAKELRRKIDRGEDPLGVKQLRRGDPTFGDLVEQYLAIEAQRQKGFAEYERILRRDALPEWKNFRAADIRRRDVIALIEEKAKTAPIGANRLFELLRRAFNFGIRRDMLEANPCALVRKPGEERSKDRVLSRDEIRTLWTALDGPGFSEHTAAALRLILVTAQRPGEVITVEWDEIDLGEAWWTLPAEKAKNGLAHRVPLNTTARAILESLPRVSKFVFPSPRDSQPMHRAALALALRRAREREEDALEVKGFAPHDLRRTAASHMASAGVERFVIGRVLNHVEPGVTRVYDRHSYDAEKSRALLTWERRLCTFVGNNSEQARVVEMGAR